ncbi:MAG: hypothetical protein SFT94_01250 [Pseudanabaenaceae cyanobacterium bins.68]|nr:hypothetical protein [Pseudanabaenaceae cyanobacterium bins.68]
MPPQKDILPDPDLVDPAQRLSRLGFKPVIQTFQSLNFSVSRTLLLLSIPILGLVIFLAFKVLTDPVNFYWLVSSEAPSLPAYGLEPPLTLEEINAQLKDSERVLGKGLDFGEDRQRQRAADPIMIYPVLDQVSQEMREIRAYQTRPNSKKLQLVSRVEVDNLDDWFVLKPRRRFGQGKVSLKGESFPLKQLQLIEGEAPRYGRWLIASGTRGKTEYGLVLGYVAQPRPSLTILTEWSGPKPPRWQNLLQLASAWTLERDPAKPAVPGRDPQLILEQHQDLELDFEVYQPELTTNPQQPIDLRQITLNEGLGMPNSYAQALVLASGGLWSDALTRLEQVRIELRSQSQEFSNYVWEQHGLIAAHAQLLSEQFAQAKDPGRQALLQMLDGKWQGAIAIAESNETNTRAVFAAVKPYLPNILGRVELVQKLKLDDVAIAEQAGAIAVMASQGLQGGKKWLNGLGGDQSVAIDLINRLDVFPFKIQPQQLFGTVTPVISREPGAGWAIPPEPLPETDSWYVAEITLMLDQDLWQGGNFAELVGRSPVAVWKLLNLKRNNILNLLIQDNLGLSNNAFLRAHSYAVSSTGKLRLLLSGGKEVSQGIRESSIPAIVTTNGILPATTGTDTTPINLPTPILERMSSELYGELQSLGEVSLRREEFRRQFSSWNLKAIDLSGDGKVDYVLELDRLKVDMGDRRYPTIVAFNSEGQVIYSEITGDRSRRWVTILPGRVSGQILTEIDGNYEVWSLP